MPWAICLLPLLMSATITVALAASGSLSTSITCPFFTLTLSFTPAAVVSLAPSALAAWAAVIVAPGTTW